MNKTAFINLAKDLALAALVTALIYSFICAVSFEWVNILGDSHSSLTVRVVLVTAFYGTAIGSSALRKWDEWWNE